VLISHSMGHRYAAADGDIALKLLGEPIWRTPEGVIHQPDQHAILAC
jgi:hypothetical protein